MSKANPKQWLGPTVILLAALAAITPQLLRGNSCGHDFDFHLVSWMDALNSWKHGILYPHWAPSPNYSAGEPRFVFYPPLTWMLGAALGSFLPWHLVPIALTFLLLAGTGIATRALARQALDNFAATVAGCVAIFSGYCLFTAYERTAFGELAGGFWIPLLLLFALRQNKPEGTMLQRTFDGSTAMLALVVAGAWLSNDPLGVMASYLLAAVAIVASLLARSWAPLLRAITAATLGLALTAVYLIPAAIEQKWVNVKAATSYSDLRIENNWIFAHHANQDMISHDVVLHRTSIIVACMIFIALAGAAICWTRGLFKANHRWWIPLALIPLLVLLLQLPISLPIWNLLPKMRFLQFPWRWTVVVEAPMAILLVASLWSTKKRYQILLCSAFACCIFAILHHTYTSFWQFCDNEDSVSAMLQTYNSGTGFLGNDEYAPIKNPDTTQEDADPQLPISLPDACLIKDTQAELGQPQQNSDALTWDKDSCIATYTAAEQEPERLHLNAAIPQAGFLVFRLRSYPAWSIHLNGRPTATSIYRQDGLLTLPISQGQADVLITWATTPDMLIGRLVSAAALILLAAIFWWERSL